MERRYVAFISYRHLPLDMLVAEKLHKMIERYRVPKELRRSPDQKTLGTVFRDREELPLSNDLTQDIYDALDDSEFLIVVCTPDTPKSLWVDREIEHFLEKHDRDHIITVLASGTPEEAIPKRITHIYGEDGKTVLEQREPLCAFLVDADPHKVLWNLRKEFLRLVAAILERPYDSIRQRQKLYRQKQAMAVFGAVAAVALSFAAVLASKNHEIQSRNDQIQEQNLQIQAQKDEIARQLENALLNESEALTLLSGIQLAEGDRMAALESALLALPSTENERPYYAAAKTALEDALYLYESGYLVDRRLTDEWLAHQTLSEDGRYAVGDTIDAMVTCFDLYTGEVLWKFPMDDYAVMSLWFLPEQSAVLYVSSSGVQYVLNMDGSLRCQYEFYKRSEPADFSPAGDVMAFTDDERVVFCSLTEQKLLRSDTVTGGSRIHACRGAYCADGSRFLMLCEDDYGSGKELRASFFDAGTGKMTESFTLSAVPESGCWDMDILGLADNSWFVSFLGSEVRYQFRINESGVLAQSEYAIPGDRASGISSHTRQVGDRIMLILPDGVYCLDAESCALLTVTELYWLGDLQVCQLWEDGSFLALEEGTVFGRYTVSETGALVDHSRWKYSREIEGWACTETNPNVFLVSDGNGEHIIRWMDGVGDSFAIQEELPVTLSGNLIYLPNFCSVSLSPSGKNIFIMDNDATDQSGYRQYVYNMESGSTYAFTGEIMPGHQGVFTSDETKLISGNRLFDMQTGAVTTLEGSGVWATVHPNDQIPGEAALTACYEVGVLRWWLDGVFCGETRNPYYETGEAVSVTAGQNGLILLQTDAEHPYAAYDTRSDTWYTVEADIAPGSLACLGKEEKRAAFREPGGDLYVYDFETAEVILYAPELAHLCDAMYFVQEDEKVLMISSLGTCSVASIYLGEWQSWDGYTFSEYAVDAARLQLREDPNGDDLYLASSAGEFDGCIIRDWLSAPEKPVSGMLGYLPEANALLCVDADQQQMFIQRRLALEDLIALGNALLSGQRD